MLFQHGELRLLAAARRPAFGGRLLQHFRGVGFEEFCTVLCENYGGWRWSILLGFWRILGFSNFGFLDVDLNVTVNLERIWH